MPNRNVMIKPSSGLCNLRCKYCFYCDEASKRQIESFGYMTEDTLEQVIRQTLQEAEHEVTICYQGGEPTLRGLAFFQQALVFQEQYNKNHIKIHNAIQTNGVSLTPAFLTFFKEHHFLVGISLDGTEFTHNAFRVDQAGHGTFEAVMHTIKQCQMLGIDYNILTVVNGRTARQASKIYAFYKEQGFEYIQFIACLQPLFEEQQRYEYTLTCRDYAKFLKTMFDLWYQDIRQGKQALHIQQFENYVQMLLGYPPTSCGMSGVCSYQYVVEADGEVYPCDFYMLDEYRLGNLNQVTYTEIDRKREELHFLEHSVNRHEDCEHCQYAYLCRGGCKRQRITQADSSNEKNYFCEAFYDFFAYTMPRLRELAEHFKQQGNR